MYMSECVCVCVCDDSVSASLTCGIPSTLSFFLKARCLSMIAAIYVHVYIFIHVHML